MKITLVLHNIRSVYNVGAILRTAEGMGVTEVLYSGYTPRYEDVSLLPHLREKLNRQIEKAALGAEKIVPQTSLGTETERLLEYLENCGHTVVGLENNLSKEEIPRRVILGESETASGAKASFGEEIILLLGEEVHGIPAELREKMNYFLEIPMQGRKESFNVSVATGMALWGLLNCY